MTGVNTEIVRVYDDKTSFLIDTDVTIDELLEASDDDFLWDIASNVVSKYLNEIVIVSSPSYIPIRINENNSIRVRIDCYLE